MQKSDRQQTDGKILHFLLMYLFIKHFPVKYSFKFYEIIVEDTFLHCSLLVSIYCQSTINFQL